MSMKKQNTAKERLNSLEENIIVLKENLIIVAKRDRKFLIQIEKISKCQADDNKTVFHFYNGENIIATKCLKEFELKLINNGFIKINRGTMIPIKLVKFISKNSVGLTDGSVLKLEEKQKEMLMKIL